MSIAEAKGKWKEAVLREHITKQNIEILRLRSQVDDYEEFVETEVPQEYSEYLLKKENE